MARTPHSSPQTSRPTRWARAVAVLAAVLLAAEPATAACPPREGRAATLLFPYFEVDLDGTKTTLLSIVYPFPATAAYALARVTLWTDWGIPTGAFDIYLARNQVKTMNLRDLLLTGVAPVTHPPAEVPNCGTTVGGLFASPAALQGKHTGGYGSSCWSSPRSDRSLATGYVTVDVVRRCSSVAINPTSPGYFTGASPVASTANVLFGDFLLVDPANNYAAGQQAVSIVADPTLFGVPSYTFYGRYVGWSGADKRRPLARVWDARYLIGGPFGGGTQLLVWRDNKRASVSSASCGTGPVWWPLNAASLSANSEGGAYHGYGQTFEFDALTQRVDVATEIDPPYDFGWLELDLGLSPNNSAQGWVGWLASADGRYSVGLAATPLTDDPCQLRP